MDELIVIVKPKFHIINETEHQASKGGMQTSIFIYNNLSTCLLINDLYPSRFRCCKLTDIMQGFNTANPL